MYLKLTRNILIMIFILVLSLYAQSQEQTIMEVEKTTISAGGEFSIMLQKTINSGTADKFMVSKSKSDRNISSIEAITPLLGMDFDTDAALTGWYHIPPDPIGVSGLSHLVAVNNTSIWWANKDGSSVVSKRLGKNGSDAIGSFFETLVPVNGTFDPKVIYDQYNNRFVVVTLEQVQSSTRKVDPTNTSRILVAVSASSDPNGTWYYHAINSKINIGGDEAWADYPGFAVNSDAILTTANLFSYNTSSYKGSRLWVIEKSAFYGGSSAVGYVFDPATDAGIGSTTMQPAHMFGTEPTNLKAYLVRYSGYNSSGNDLLSVIEFTGSYVSPSFSHNFYGLGDVDNNATAMPDAAQLGSTKTIETNDRRALHAIWRNNYLYSTETVVGVSGGDAGQATSHWTKLNASIAGGLSFRDQGTCGGEDIAVGTYTFMSSIAVNSNDEMVVGFAASAATIYPGAYYAGRIPTDAVGATPNTGTLKAGEDYYYRAFGGTRNRWGDYSGISVDPSDDKTFWVFNQFAKTRGTVLVSYPTEDGRWATTFGKIVDAPLPVELTTFSAKEIKSKIILNWQTATEVNNYGFSIERKSEVVKREWETLAFVEGHGNSNSPKDYTFIDDTPLNGKVGYRLKQIDTDGTFEYSDEIEIEVESVIENKLVGNYPNPFNPTTTVRFDLANEGNVSLVVYNALGEVVKKLLDQKMTTGKHKVEFDASNLSSGIYFYQLNAGNFMDVKKMMVIK